MELQGCLWAGTDISYRKEGTVNNCKNCCGIDTSCPYYKEMPKEPPKTKLKFTKPKKRLRGLVATLLAT